MWHMHILQLVSSGLIGVRKKSIKVTWRLWKCFLALNSLVAKWSSGFIGDHKHRNPDDHVKLTWRLWKCFLVLNSLVAKPGVGNPAPRLLSFVFIGYQGHPLHCFSLPPTNIFMVEIWEYRNYFQGRNIFMAEIWECQKYFHVRNIFMPGIFSWWKYEFVRNKIFRALLSITCTTMFCQLGMRSSSDYETTIFCGTDSLLHWKMGPWNDNRGWN